MAYSPGLPDVLEVDDGYLVLRPDNTYLEIVRIIDMEQLEFQSGTYERLGERLRLHPLQGPDHEPGPSSSG